MRVPLGWLRDYVQLDASTARIVEKLAMLGFPVESVEQRKPLSGVVIGKLTKVEKHPNADRLQVCTVDVGDGRPLTIATAAPNVAQGQIVPVAKIGAQLTALKIEPRKMRGIESQGMLVSANEIGFEADWFEDGILILEENAPIGRDFIEHLRLNDDVIEVEITANRVDAMCMVGIARELSVAFKAPLTLPAQDVEHFSGDSSDVSVRIESPDCRHFVAQRADGLTVRPAPASMRLRLALAGQRPINNLVDISNFVMLETGQPLHFYDYAKIGGKTLVARDARAGETIRTLDGEERTLDPRILVIADAERAQGIAGIKGGSTSEVDDGTTSIVIEAATFDGPRVRRGGIALALRTDASARHEKGLPVALAPLGAARAARLLAEEGAAIQAPRSFGEPVPEPRTISLPKAEVPRLLGISLADSEIETSLTALGFFAKAEGASFKIAIPLWRDDVRIEADVIEELARSVGYDRIEPVVPPLIASSLSSEVYDLEARVASIAAAAGYREIVTFSLQPGAIAQRYEDAGIALDGKPVEIVNPLSEDQRFMRFSLVPAILDLAGREFRGAPLRCFELGHVFAAASPMPEERAFLVWALITKPREEPPWHDEDFLTFKGEAEAMVRAITGRMPSSAAAHYGELHPGKTAALSVDGNVVAYIGALDPRLVGAFGVEASVYAGYLALETVPAYRVPKYAAPSRFPGVARDVALVLATDVAASAVEQTIRTSLDGIAREVRVFDEYRGPQVGEGKKSLAVRLLLARDDATMTDAEADAHLKRALAALQDRLGATIRS